MSFSMTRGHLNPVVSYYYDTGAQQRFTTWHVLFVFVLLAAAIGMFFVQAVNSNLQLALAEIPVPIVQVPKPTLTPAVASASAPTQKVDDLQTDINTWLAAHKGVDWGVHVEAFDGSQSASVNPDKMYSLASVYKLFLLQPLVQKAPSSTWATTSIGNETYAACVDAMIRVSDNACAEAIGDKIGWLQAEKYLRSIGYAKTSFIGATTTGTTSETATLLRHIYLGEGFDSLTRSSTLEAMRAPKRIEGIRMGCPDCTVYNKTGDLAGYHNDAAIVEKNGKAFSIVIFSKTGSWQQIAELTKVISAHF